MRNNKLQRPTSDTEAQLQLENEALRARLAEVEEILHAISYGEVDALVMSGAGGAQVFTLKSADRPYRVLIEDMSEGALTLTPEGIILYCNRRFAAMMQSPPEKVIASRLEEWLEPAERRRLPTLVREGGRGETVLRASDGSRIPVLLSFSEVTLEDGEHLLCLVATDLTEQKRHEAAVMAERQAQFELQQSDRARRALLSLLEDQKRAKERYQSIFQLVPVSIWEEDWSAVIAMVKELHRSGVTDFARYFDEHPEFVVQALRQVNILDVNNATLNVFKAGTKADILTSLETVFATPDTLPGFVSELIALAEEKSVFETEMSVYTVSKELIHVLLTMSFPALESNSGTVLVSLMDITKRKQAEARIEENARRHRQLANLSVSINATTRLEEKLQTLTDGARETIGAHMSVTSLTTDRSWAQTISAVSLSDKYAEWRSYNTQPTGCGIYTLVCESNRPLRLTQAELESHPNFLDFQGEKDHHPPLNGLLAIPLIGHDGSNLGLMMLSDKHEGTFTPDDEAILVQMAQMASGAIEQDRLLKVTRQRLAELEAVNTIVRSLRVVPTHQELLGLFMDTCLATLDFAAGYFLWRDLISDQLVPMARRGLFADLELIPLENGEQLLQEMIATGDILLVEDFQNNERIPLSLRNQVPSGWAGVCATVQSSDLQEGVLILASHPPLDPASYSPHLFATLLDIFGNSLHRARLLQDAQERADHLTLINQLGRDLSGTFDPQAIYGMVSDAARKLFPDVEAILISRYDSQRQLISAAHIYHDGTVENASEVPPIPLEPPGKGTQSEVIHTRQPVIINNHAEAIQVLKHPRENTGSEGIRSAICTPMLAQGEVVGVLCLQHRKMGRFDEADAELLTWIANTSAIALHNAELFLETLKKVEQQKALRVIDLAITSSLDLRVTLDVILDRITALQKVDAAAILLINADTQMLRFASGRGFRTKRIERRHLYLGEGMAGCAALERRVIRGDSPEQMSQHWRDDRFYKLENFSHYLAVPLIAKGKVQGVLELYDSKPFPISDEWQDFLEMIASQAAIAVDNAHMLSDLQRANIDLALAYDKTIEGWSNALDLRDKETEGHTLRVTEMTLRLAHAAGMSQDELVHVRRGALLHDIGKMGIPDAILLKPDKLTDEEWEIMRRHPAYAYELLSPIAYLRPALDIPYGHHEKWDGTGYPRGLKGEQIPLSARLFAVVDVWDALRSDRPYRKAWPEEKVHEHIRSLVGTHFDPKAVELFFQVMSEQP